MPVEWARVSVSSCSDSRSGAASVFAAPSGVNKSFGALTTFKLRFRVERRVYWNRAAGCTLSRAATVRLSRHDPDRAHAPAIQIAAQDQVLIERRPVRRFHGD